jgi:hypothetical protein
MFISNYVYGEAANNMHGKLSDAIDAGAITEIEAQVYRGQSHCLMSGKSMKGEFREHIQFKLDKFFKKDDIDYSDFQKVCIEASGDKHVTVVCLSLFKEGKRCYYTANGDTVDVAFTSRFEALGDKKIGTIISLELWLVEFHKITAAYIESINWDTVIWNDGEIEQAGDDFQLEAFRNVFESDDCNPSVQDWDHYDDSCDARMDFQRELTERYEVTLKEREMGE